MADVFISYSSKDSESAEYVLKTLESMFISCWMAPRDIPKGGNFADAIPSAIRSAGIFLILVSRNSQESPQVRNELSFATHCKLPIASLMLDSEPLNDNFQYHISQANQFDAKSRLVAAVSDLVSWAHEELKRQAEAQHRPEVIAEIHTVVPLAWYLFLTVLWAIPICLCCILTKLQILALDELLKAIFAITILALAGAVLTRTPLFREDAAFYKLLVRIIEKIRTKK